MDVSYRTTLELDKIIARAVQLCTCAETKEMMRAIEPFATTEEERYALAQTNAINALLLKNGSPRFGAVHEVRRVVAHAAKGGILSMGELLEIAAALRNFSGLAQWYGLTDHDMLPTDDLFFALAPQPVLEKQIEEVSAGTIPGKAIKLSLSIAIALAMALAMLRVVTGISILWFLVPGYAIALGLSFFVPNIYTAIAFDSGGVASGPMTATFMLQFMVGVSIALGGNVLTDAFGIVAMVAMMPLLSIQVVGFYYQRKARKVTQELESYGDCDIIELWEEPA
jgi:NADH:ubiquinone oxidoreductase subunit 3 (subunit A)